MPNDEYENVVPVHMEAAAECIPTKAKAKCRVPWESLVVWEKRDNLKKASLLKKTKIRRNSKCQRIEKKVLRELANIPKKKKKEQQEYIQVQIDTIRNSVVNRKLQES